MFINLINDSIYNLFWILLILINLLNLKYLYINLSINIINIFNKLIERLKENIKFINNNKGFIFLIIKTLFYNLFN